MIEFTGTIGTANGSAFVRLGQTKVLTAIQSVVTVPTERAPKQGILGTPTQHRLLLLAVDYLFCISCTLAEVNVNLGPIASPYFRSGRTSDESLTLSQFLTRSIVDSEALDLESLCIKPGKAVWSLKADVVCTDYSGNIEDTSVLSLVAALTNTLLPAPTLGSDGVVTVSPNIAKATPLPLQHIPLPLSFVLVESRLLVDPTAEETSLSSAHISIVSTVEGLICQMRCLCNDGHVSEELLQQTFDLVRESTQRHYDILQKSDNPRSLPGVHSPQNPGSSLPKLNTKQQK